jgi:hypothetical protein
MLADDGEVDADSAFELAALFCKGARRRVDRLFDELWHNDDADNYAAAQAVLSGRYTWAEGGILDPSGEGPMLGTAGPEHVREAKLDVQPDSVAAGPRS